MSIKKRSLLALAGLATVAASALGTAAPASASTASLYERYLCGSLDVSGDTASRLCTGTWAVGNPTRSLKINATVFTNGASFRSTFMTSIQSLDGALYTLYWRCMASDNSLSGIVGTSHIGGSYGNSWSWGSPGYHPCDGYSKGMFASVYRDYAFVSYNSRLQWNTNGAAGGSNIFGYQAGWPEEYYS